MQGAGLPKNLKNYSRNACSTASCVDLMQERSVSKASKHAYYLRCNMKAFIEKAQSLGMCLQQITATMRTRERCCCKDAVFCSTAALSMLLIVHP